MVVRTKEVQTARQRRTIINVFVSDLQKIYNYVKQNNAS